MGKLIKGFGELTIMVLCTIFIFSMLHLVDKSFDNVEAAEGVEDYKIIGYYPSWGAYGRDYQVSDMDVSNVTHINYAFADICWEGRHGNPAPNSPNPQTWTCQDEAGVIDVPDGSIVLGDPWIDVQKSHPGDKWDEPIRGNIKQLNLLKEDNPNLKTIISVGGWSWSNRFSDVAASADTRDNFANSAVEFLRKYDFDGVDLDWEYPVGGGLDGNSVRPEDKQNHTLLLQAVRDKLDVAGLVDGKEYLLTIASSAGPEYIKNNEVREISEILDWINIMTYDFNGGWQKVSAHNAPLYFDQAAEDAGVPHAEQFNAAVAVQGHIDAGVPANKVVLGTPFYGRGWGGCEDVKNGQYQNCTGVSKAGTWEDGVFDFTDLEDNYINKNGYTRYWNDVAKVPYLYNPSNGNFISYDDEESFGHKVDFIKSTGLGGAMFWEFSGDRNNVLLDKLTSELEGPVTVDNEKPTVPANLRVTEIASKSVGLAWDASTDNVGVAGYTVSYGEKTVDVKGTTITISELSPKTSYTFTVRARDLAGNQSSESNQLNITTDESGDLIAPTIPTDLEVTGTTISTVNLSWKASTDNVGVTGYTVSYGDQSIDVLGTTAAITDLESGTTYTFKITAKDAEGNESDAATIQATTKAGNICLVMPWKPSEVYTGGARVSYQGKIYEAKWWTQGEEPNKELGSDVWKYIEDCEDGNGGNDEDMEPPTRPADLQVPGKTKDSVELSWHPSTDNGADLCIEPKWAVDTVYHGGNKVSHNGKQYEAKWWTQGDNPGESGDWGVWGFIDDCDIENGGDEDDIEAPTVPDNLKVTNKTTESVTLNWDASIDNVAVAGYDVYNGSKLVASVMGTSATVIGLKENTEYSFTVVAKDEAGNVSDASKSVVVTTDSGTVDPPLSGDRQYVTYASSWNTSIYDLMTANIPNYITHVNLAFARPNTAYTKGSFEFDQEVSGFEFVEGATSPTKQNKFTEQEKTDLLNNIAALTDRGTEVWISIGGWSYSQGTQWEDFNAPHVVDLALDLGASGVDIDWESSGSSCNNETADKFSCSKDDEVADIITTLHDEIQSRGVDLGISIAGWSTGAYYVKDTPFEEGKVQWGSPYGGTMYSLVKNHGDKLDFINLMSYDGGTYYDPREGYESYRAIYDGPINVGMEIAPEGAGGAVLALNAPEGTVYDAEMLTGENNIATKYYNVETLVNYVSKKGQANDGFMLWQLWKQRVHQPAPEGAATENSAGQYICENLPLVGDCSQTIPTLPMLQP